MTHIASCLSLNNATSTSEGAQDPAYSQTSPDFAVESGYSDLVRRANKWKQNSTPKYLLWPYQSKGPTTPPGEATSDEKVMALSIARSTSSLSDTTSPSSHDAPFGLRPKAGSFSRRRRPGVTELGSMATVQESTTVDSPTIPGRPPVRKLSKYPKDTSLGHGRSSSAPGSSWRNNPFGDAMISCVSEPATMNVQWAAQAPTSTESPSKKKMLPATRFVPTQLEPIVSPAHPAAKESRPQLQIRTKPEFSTAQEDTPPAPPPKTAPIGGRNSPASNRPTPTRKNSFNTLARMASASQIPVERTSAESLDSKSPEPKAFVPANMASASPMAHRRQHSDVSGLDASPLADISVVNRGRPIKRAQSFDHHDRSGSASASPVSSSEPKEVWKLPNGLKRVEAMHRLSESDKQKLQRQAASQAEKFEILGERDIATLSKELRALDERCEYLRKTYRSLRRGRQKLHARMMSYLKRENGAIFTRDGLIRQEEALAELDASLDDWIGKIEQAENRRLRIRQKVLEHFCAAITLTPQPGVAAQTSLSPITSVTGASHVGIQVQGLQGTQEQTPPRSPVEKADSPRLASLLPSAPAMTIATVIPDHEAKPLSSDSPKLGDPEKRRDVQSIKIYADGNVLDLFSDIEQAIDNMFDYDEKRGTIGLASELQDAVVNEIGNGHKGSASTR
ncbi:MAG: hypothetical protein M1821_003597 [Bathelium mastoideum]|nr:MAG: hypothetical protein M1821_003597 [Bathelium mastoideum]